MQRRALHIPAGTRVPIKNWLDHPAGGAGDVAFRQEPSMHAVVIATPFAVS
jgi:hypothetical protein